VSNAAVRARYIGASKLGLIDCISAKASTPAHGREGASFFSKRAATSHLLGMMGPR